MYILKEVFLLLIITKKLKNDAEYNFTEITESSRRSFRNVKFHDLILYFLLLSRMDIGLKTFLRTLRSVTF